MSNSTDWRLAFRGRVDDSDPEFPEGMKGHDGFEGIDGPADNDLIIEIQTNSLEHRIMCNLATWSPRLFESIQSCTNITESEELIGEALDKLIRGLIVTHSNNGAYSLSTIGRGAYMMICADGRESLSVYPSNVREISLVAFGEPKRVHRPKGFFLSPGRGPLPPGVVLSLWEKAEIPGIRINTSKSYSPSVYLSLEESVPIDSLIQLGEMLKNTWHIKEREVYD